MKLKHICVGLLLLAGVGTSTAAEPPAGWRDRLRFHASFDRSPDADFAIGDRHIYTASNMSRDHVQPGLGTSIVAIDHQGRWGGCLRFRDTTESVVFFSGKDNVPYARDAFGMTISFWMRLSPDEDLKPGYVDPLQLTDKQWNNAALFVDFTKDERPRHFRLGVFSDYSYWNPQDTAWEQIAESDRPMVTVPRPPFSRDRWTHVAITLDGINAVDQNANSTLYLDGAHQGALVRGQKFTWDPEKVAIMLGIQYIGAIDDFAIFSQAMNAQEIQVLKSLPNGVAALH
jgi:hypothetical protein